jgi:hypothetical protein
VTVRRVHDFVCTDRLRTFADLAGQALSVVLPVQAAMSFLKHLGVIGILSLAAGVLQWHTGRGPLPAQIVRFKTLCTRRSTLTHLHAESTVGS